MLNVSTTKDLSNVLDTRLSAEGNVVSSANKPRRMLIYLKRYFAALTSPEQNVEYGIQASNPILSRDTDEWQKVQNLALKFFKGLRHVPYKKTLQQYQLLSITNRWIRRKLMSMFEITQKMSRVHLHPPNPYRGTRLLP